jgi:transcriptional regulator with GAF, ATPase, and Fis domain
MTGSTREDHLVETFVAIAGSLMEDYGVIDVLQTLVDRSVAIFDAAGAGILLADEDERLEVMASSSERSEFMELMHLRAGEGPCVEAITTGQVVSVRDVGEIQERWPRFAELARGAKYASIHAIPMGLRGTTIGSLNLFRTSTGELNEADAAAAQALSDVATVSILQDRRVREADIGRAQLQRALDSRVVIEQAKGYLARTQKVDPDTAFQQLRQHARSTSAHLHDVAARVIAGELELR